MKRMLPLLVLVCLLLCTACGASKQIEPTTTTAAAFSSGTLPAIAATTDRVTAASALQTATTTALVQPTTAGSTTAAASTARTTAPHTTAPLTTLTLTTVLTSTTAPTTRRVYTTTPFTTKAKVRTTTTRPADPTAAPATTAAPEEEGTTRAAVHTCTVSINCSVVVDNSKLKAGKAAFVPTGGQILVPVTVTFTPGEDAYTVLRRACAENTCVDRCAYCAKDGIQLEAAYTPGYNTYYVQGIHQIYEKDCGAKSGWLYRVNGVYPNVGSSSYTVRDGDRIDWIYTLEPIMD